MFEYEASTDPVEQSKRVGRAFAQAHHELDRRGIKSFLFKASSVGEFDARLDMKDVSANVDEVADKYLNEVSDGRAKIARSIRKEYEAKIKKADEFRLQDAPRNNDSHCTGDTCGGGPWNGHNPYCINRYNPVLQYNVASVQKESLRFPGDSPFAVKNDCCFSSNNGKGCPKCAGEADAQCTCGSKCNCKYCQGTTASIKQAIDESELLDHIKEDTKEFNDLEDTVTKAIESFKKDDEELVEKIKAEGSIKEAEYKYVKHRGDKWVIIQKGTGKVLSTHDSEEKAKSAFRAMMMNKHGNFRQANDGPAAKNDPGPGLDQSVPNSPTPDQIMAENAQAAGNITGWSNAPLCPHCAQPMSGSGADWICQQCGYAQPAWSDNPVGLSAADLQ